MARFRKKPVVIDAIQMTGGNTLQVVQFIRDGGGRYSTSTHPIDAAQDQVFIHTLEGEMRAVDSDWIVRGVQGEFYPCKPDIFAKTYESADEPSDSDRLAALEAAGVDNWEGYGNAMAVLRGEAEEDY